jgi:hypothetical protein
MGRRMCHHPAFRLPRMEVLRMPRKLIVPSLVGCICGDPNCVNLFGKCHCGCGMETRIHAQNFAGKPAVKGIPRAYIHGHQNRIRPTLEEAMNFKINGNYCRLIALSQGLYAIVDADDYPWLMQWKWYARRKKNGTPGFYVYRNIRTDKGVGSLISMHQQIAGTKDFPNVDHRDGCGLNNFRANLRPCTVSQNGANRGIPADNTSGFKGVKWIECRRKYRSRVRHMGEDIFCGYFDAPEDAARAYDRKAVEVFGEFAYLNFPNELSARGR